MVTILRLVFPFKKLEKIKKFTTTQMGTDIIAHLLYGFKITLSQAFETGLLRPEIMEDDDWQLVGEKDCRHEIIDRHVGSPLLSALLENGEWNLYILASTQSDCDPAASFLFIHNRRDILYSGRIPDYECGVIDAHHAERISALVLPGMEVEYAIHWVVEGSW